MFSKLLYIVNISMVIKIYEKGGGKQPFKQPSPQHLAVTLKINIYRPNFSSKYDKLNKYSSKMYINIVHFFSKK